MVAFGMACLVGCANLEKLADEKLAEALEEKGCEDFDIEGDEHDKKTFDFRAKCKDYMICEGSIEFDRRMMPSKWETAYECALDEKACKKKRPKVCAKLGDAAHDPKDASSAEKANGFWEKACEGGDGKSCRNFALNMQLGRGTKKDLARVAALYEQGCGHGDGPSCAFGGYRFASGRGVPKDTAKAKALYERGCNELKDGASCNNFGVMYSRGWGVARNRKLGAELSLKGCDYGDGYGCAYVGLLHIRGSYGIKRDKPRGLAMQIGRASCRERVWLKV
jgi:TPR repeat protein